MRRLLFGMLLVTGLAAGCSSHSRTLQTADRETFKRATTLTAREWGYRYERDADGGLVYRAAQPMGYVSGNNSEELFVATKYRAQDGVRVTVYFSGPTAGTEQFFLGDLQQNLSKVTAVPNDSRAPQASATLAGHREP